LLLYHIYRQSRSSPRATIKRPEFSLALNPLIEKHFSMNIEDLLNPPAARPAPATSTSRVNLPPLVAHDFPPTPWNHPPMATPDDFDVSDSGRSGPYTLADDLSILKVVGAYFGTENPGKIPWSFWQTYKRVTGSTRSNSSLYHHWNGSIKRKYDTFLSTGRLNDCLLWLETAVMSGDTSGAPPPPTGAPLRHHRSEPPVPLPSGEGRALIRTGSLSAGAHLSFLRPK
jgi:hypothetical protein